MIKVLWAAVLISALALGVSVFGAVISNSAVTNQAARTDHMAQQIRTEQNEIARLQAQLVKMHASSP